MIEMAERAEELGIGSVWVGDSMIDSPRYEPLSILGAVAARTNRIKLGGSIIQPHFRNPIMLALSWATLDHLSSGRMILTLGIGGGTPSGVAREAELAGVPVRKRGRALEENVEILRKLWRGEELDYDGEIYHFKGAKIGYSPVQNPPPIWIGAGVWVPKKREQTTIVSATPGYLKREKSSFSGAFDRVARLADGWFTIMIHPEEFKEKSELISDLARKHGRSPDDISRAVECWFNVNSDGERARSEITGMIEKYFSHRVDPETVERWSIYGTREECLGKIEKYFDSGADIVKLIMGSEDQGGMLETAGKSILSSF